MKLSSHGQLAASALKEVTTEEVSSKGILLAIWYAAGKSLIAKDWASSVHDELYDDCLRSVANTNSESEISFGRIQEYLYG